MNRAVLRERGWMFRSEHEARVVDAVMDYVTQKRDQTHQWPSLDDVARARGWSTGFQLADASRTILGARPFAIWQECQAEGSVAPIHRRVVRAW